MMFKVSYEGWNEERWVGHSSLPYALKSDYRVKQAHEMISKGGLYRHPGDGCPTHEEIVRTLKPVC